MVTTRRSPPPSVTRRGLLRGATASLLGVALGACSSSEGASAAYEPWLFPKEGEGPELSLVHAALLAANPHDTQPWRFRVESGAVRVYVDDARSLGAMDPIARERHVGLGCALENMAVAAPGLGLAVDVRIALDEEPGLVAVVGVTGAPRRSSALGRAIARRHTNRGPYGDQRLDPAFARALPALGDDPLVALHLFDAPASMVAFADGTRRATRLIVDDDEMLRASDAWFRYGDEEIERLRDGVTLRAQGLGALERALGGAMGRLDPKTSGDYWIARTEGVHTAAVGAYAALSTPALESREQAVRVGRLFQRVHLFCASEGVALQPLNQMAERRDREHAAGAPGPMSAALAALVPSGRHAQMLFRLGYAWDDAPPSPRRPVDWVVEVAS
jgi:hypothetical protein